jgi:hypothetical protein
MIVDKEEFVALLAQILRELEDNDRLHQHQAICNYPYDFQSYN